MITEEGMIGTDGRTLSVPPAESTRAEAEFISFVQAGGIVEPTDWMPDGYRQALIRFIEMHANSEYMGALLERDWMRRAPTLERCIGTSAKVQDEVGHAQVLYCILEDLGRPRRQVLADLAAGRSKFHSFFHYFTESWADVGVIAWLSDAASVIAQKALLHTSYGPYRRVLQKINWEEGFHVVYGREVMNALTRGTAEQLRLAQDALTRWWPRLMFFHGPATPPERDTDLTLWKIKSRANEDMRQEFLRTYVPRIRELGLSIVDPQLSFDADTQLFTYAQPDWNDMRHVGRGHGPASRSRIEVRNRLREENRWVLETIGVE